MSNDRSFFSKYKVTILISFVLLALALVYFSQASTAKERVLARVKADDYQELVTNNYILTLNQEQNRPNFKSKLEDYYFDKNILVFSIRMDYWEKDSAEFHPVVEINNQYDADNVTLNYGDDYLYLMPAKNIKDGDMISIGMHKQTMSDLGGWASFEAHKTVSDELLQEFELQDASSGQKIADLTLSPYGTILLMTENYNLGEDANSFVLEQNNAEEIAAQCIINGKNSMIVFPRQLTITTDDLTNQQINFNQYQVVNEQKSLIQSSACQLKAK